MSQRLIIYLLFMYIGIVFNFAGVLSIVIAGQFLVDTAVVGYIFCLFSVGYSLAILINGFLLERFSFRRLVASAHLLTFGAIVAATNTDYLAAFAAAIFVSGIGLGMLCSNGNFYIIGTCRGQERTSKLNILNFFYSFGAIVSPLAAGYLLAIGLSWQQIYLSSLLPLVLLALSLALFRFDSRLGVDKSAAGAWEPWPISVYLIGAALFCYVISEMILTYWIIIYLFEAFGEPLERASTALSLFWTFMAVGRLLTGFAAGHIRVSYLILSCSGLSFLLFAAMLTAGSAGQVILLAGALGFGYSGLYASILSFGTMQLKHSSPRLMTFFVTVGSAGGILSFLVSSYLKQHYGLHSALLLSLAAMGLVFVCSGVALVLDHFQRKR